MYCSTIRILVFHAVRVYEHNLDLNQVYLSFQACFLFKKLINMLSNDTKDVDYFLLDDCG